MHLHRIFICFFLLFIIRKLWRKITYIFHHKSQRLPPGPPKLPIIGNLHQLMGPNPPHYTFTNLAKKHGGIMHLQTGEISNVVISTRQYAEEALKHHDSVFAQRPQGLTKSIMSFHFSGITFSSYGDTWRELRKTIVMEFLSAKRVESSRSIREEEARNLVDTISLSLGRPINLSKMILDLTNTMISKAVFGEKHKDLNEYLNLLKEGVVLGGAFLPQNFPSLRFLIYLSGLWPALGKVHKRIDEILENILDEHEAKRLAASRTLTDKGGEEDLIDVLERVARASKGLKFTISKDNIKAVIGDLFSAGGVTSPTTIEWAMAELLRNPRLLKKAQAELQQTLKGKTKIQEPDIQNLNYLTSIVKETLRLHPPVPMIPRESNENCEINGYVVPIKSRVFINVWAIDRDPKDWEDADCFKPERFENTSVNFGGSNFEYIPFGAGRRMCPGMSYGLAAVKLSLAHLLYHFDWKLADGTRPEDLDMSETLGLPTKRVNDLLVIPTLYTP